MPTLSEATRVVYKRRKNGTKSATNFLIGMKHNIKALGKLKLMHQDSKIEVENVVDRLLPIIEKQQIQTHQLIKAMTEVCMVLHKRILKLENKK